MRLPPQQWSKIGQVPVKKRTAKKDNNKERLYVNNNMLLFYCIIKGLKLSNVSYSGLKAIGKWNICSVCLFFFCLFYIDRKQILHICSRWISDLSKEIFCYETQFSSSIIIKCILLLLYVAFLILSCIIVFIGLQNW